MRLFTESNLDSFVSMCLLICCYCIFCCCCCFNVYCCLHILQAQKFNLVSPHTGQTIGLQAVSIMLFLSFCFHYIIVVIIFQPILSPKGGKKETHANKHFRNWRNHVPRPTPDLTMSGKAFVPACIIYKVLIGRGLYTLVCMQRFC